MSRIVRELLHIHERDFTRYIHRLEQATMQAGIDIRLGLEIAQHYREKIHLLGINEQTATDEEVFFVLREKLVDNDRSFRDAYKLKYSSPQLRARKLAILATKVSKKDKVLSISAAGSKRILLAVPPRRTMKLLKSKSLVSLLKRDDPRILYAIARQVEDATWQTQVCAKIKRLQAKDFGWHPPEALAVSLQWYERIKESVDNHGLQIPCPEMGITVVLPVLHQTMDGIYIYAFGTVINMLQKFVSESIAYVQSGLNTGFQSALVAIAGSTHPIELTVHGIAPSWQVVYELIVKGHMRQHAEDFELVLGEMTWQSVEMKIASLLPEFDFWYDTHFIGKPTPSGTLSLHFLDVARNLILDVPFGSQTAHHLEGSLWNELHFRYLQHESLIAHLASQLAPRGGSVL